MSTFLRSPLLSGAGLAAALIAAVAWTRPADANDPKPDAAPDEIVCREAVDDVADPKGEGIAPGGCLPDEPDCEPEPDCKIPAPQPAEPPLIEVVFVVDTTGSMSGLIEGAKRKVWSIANEILSAKPRPRLSVGLVAYRDYRDAYVTRVYQPTEDLDTVYANLMKFSADGGGDSPEHVNMALASAYGLVPFDLLDCAPHQRCRHARQPQQHQEPVRWSQDAKLKLVYLVGDAPAHRDYDQHIDYAKTTSVARQSQLTVNAVLCGGDGAARAQFTEIAQLGGGEFFQIDQSGGMTAVKTPHDEELRRLQRELESTRLYYGRADARRRAEHARGLAMDMDGEEGASRAAALSKSGRAPGPADTEDLVAGAVAGEPAPMDELEEEQLPDQLQGLSDEERKEKVAELAAKRQAVEAQIAELVKERDAFLRTNQPKDGFDARVLESLKEDAEAVGLSWE
jgi:hypothetical protein